MKMKISAAIVAAAFTVVAAAQHGVYGYVLIFCFFLFMEYLRAFVKDRSHRPGHAPAPAPAPTATGIPSNQGHRAAGSLNGSPLYTISVNSPSPTSKPSHRAAHKVKANPTSYTLHHGMPLLGNLFARTATSSDVRRSPRNPSALSRSIGSSVEPGRVISRKERSRQADSRIDSVTATMDGQVDEELDYDIVHNWAAFKAKVAAEARWPPDVRDIEEDFAHPQQTRTGRSQYNIRSLISTAILLLFVFGALYGLLDYLLSAIRASACSVTTVYVPVTYTVTAAMSQVAPLTAANDTSPKITHTFTTTHTSTVRETTTSIISAPSSPISSASAASPSSTGNPSYVYITNAAGSTEWLNGVSPSAGASLTTLTTTIIIQPVPPADSAVISQSTATHTQTVTPPAYTSTLYSYQGPDLTSTSTSTHYVTYTLSKVNQSGTITTTRSSFSGLGSSGWNMSSSSDPSLTAESAYLADPGDSGSSTLTTVGYYGIGDDITSTTTMFITSTLALQYTATITPVVQYSTGMPYITTITALPVTISPGSSGPLVSATLQSAGVNTSVSSLASAVSAALNSTLASSSALAISTSSACPNSTALSSSAVSNAPTSLAASALSATSSLAQGYSTILSALQTSSSTASGTLASGSITLTFTAGAITASQPSLTASRYNSTSLASQASYSAPIPQITATLSAPMVSRSFIESAFNTGAVISSASQSATASNSSFDPSGTGSVMPTPASTTAVGVASASQPQVNSTVSLTLSAYSPAASSSSIASSSTSLSIVNSSTSSRVKGTPLTTLSSDSTTLQIASGATLGITRTRGSPLATSLLPDSTSLHIVNTFTSTTARAKGTPLTTSSSSNSMSVPVVNSFTSNITRVKGTPLTTSLPSSSALSELTTTSPSNTSLRSGMTTTLAKGTPLTTFSFSSSTLSGLKTVTTSNASLQSGTTTTLVKGTPLTPLSSRTPQSGTTTLVQSSASPVISTTLSLATPPRSVVTDSTSSSTASLSSNRKISSQTSLPTVSSHVTKLPTSSGSVAAATTTAITSLAPSSATATPTAGCGEQGYFLLTFDDLPNYYPTYPNNTSITQAPPIFNPYHHLTFSDGYVYAPAPSEPYEPISPPHLAVFLANSTGKMSSQSGNESLPGEIGDGPLESMSAFWFDAHSAHFGCDNSGPEPCTLVFKAFTWSPTANAEIFAYGQNATIAPCTTMSDLNCQLQSVFFPTSFVGLSGLQVQAFVENEQRMFYMDNLGLSWSNSSCTAGLLRQSSP